MRIDSHQHFWKYDPERDGWITDEMPVLKRDYLPADLEPELDACGVNASVAVQADQSERETHFLLQLAEQHPFIAGIVGWTDLCAPDAAKRLENFSRFEKLRGFRHIAQAEPDERFLLREDFVRGISCLSQFDFTYDILIYPKQLAAAVELVEKFPEQRFVLDHLAKPQVKARELASWTSYIRAIAALPNVSCKLSGLITESDWRGWSAGNFKPYLDVVFEAFGTGRLMFGSDWPVCLLAGNYRQVMGLIEDYVRDLPAADRDKIFGLNAAAFYCLKVMAHGLTT